MALLGARFQTLGSHLSRSKAYLKDFAKLSPLKFPYAGYKVESSMILKFQDILVLFFHSRLLFLVSFP